MGNLIDIVSTGAVIFATAVLSVMLMELCIRELRKSPNEKAVRKTVKIRIFSLISTIILCISSLSILTILFYPDYENILVRLAGFLLIIGIIFFLISFILLYFYSKLKRK